MPSATTPQIRIYDTLAGATVELETREPGRVSMYACGPTVYNFPHLGNIRTAMSFDAIRRYLEWRGFDVTLAMNITDIDDKIINRAKDEGITEAEVARQWEGVYWEQLALVGVERPTYVTRATEYIPGMIELIQKLVDKGIAYIVPGNGVYFSVDAYPGYGELSHRDLDDLRESAGTRVEIDEEKREPIDFALWKAAKPGEPAWETPWGPGRPGWHIECSAMSLGLLGEDFDIHGGGSDLMFPHHENERAQAEAAGERFARHWMHGGMLNMAGEKMSKSLGNIITTEEAVKIAGPRALRFAALQHHYRAQMDISEDLIRSARSALDRLDALERRAQHAELDGAADRAIVDAFAAAMDNDFETPAALAVLFEAVRSANVALDAGDNATAAPLVAAVRECLGAIGMTLEAGVEQDDEIDALVDARNAARAAKDFAEADRIRDELAARGITIEDTPAGTVWHR